MKTTLDKRILLISIALIASTLIVYIQVASHEFINYDDNVYVTENPNVQKGLTGESVLWALSSGYGLNWHPLTWMSHMLDVDMFGLKPTGHHLMSLFFHILNSLLLFLVFKRMTGALWQSAFVAAVFALHPLHVESVAWAAERKDVLSTLFWILTMAAYVHYVENPNWKRYTLVALSLALGLMAKPMLVTLPLILLLLDYWPLGRFHANDQSEKGRSKLRARGNWRRYVPTTLRLVREKIPLLGLVVASSVITYIVQQHGAAVSTLEGLPLSVRVSNALVSYVVYIRKTFWPSDLGVFYPHPLNTLPGSEVTGAALLLIFISAFLLWFGRRRRYLTTGWLWFVVTLVPVIGLMQVGQQGYADRYMYVPLIGLSIVVAWSVHDLLTSFRTKRTVLVSAAAVVLAALGYCTWQQVGYWHDSAALFAHTVHVTKNNYLAHNNLGVALHLQGKYDEAAFNYSEAVRIKPDFEQAHKNLVSALLAQGKNDKAAEAELTRGTMFGQQGNSSEALAHFNEALRLNPNYADAYNNLGIVFAMQGKNTEAEDQFRQALRINPSFADAHGNLALVLEKEGKIDEAVSHLGEALRLNPGNSNARSALERLQQSRNQNPAK
jgi:tetratricopeptide (TPR) repeat protein